ncbi:MAG: C10 family peptidase [Bacteroidales bacterium]|nr:C10 family peptidase [Bacteroidales bacterium]
MKHLFFALATTIMILVACSSHDDAIEASSASVDANALAKVEQLVQDFATGLNPAAKLQFNEVRAQKASLLPSQASRSSMTQDGSIYTVTFTKNGKNGYAYVGVCDDFMKIYFYTENGTPSDADNIKPLQDIIDNLPVLLSSDAISLYPGIDSLRPGRDPIDSTAFVASSFLVKTQWGQWEPFNAKMDTCWDYTLPERDRWIIGQNYPVGCVGMAAAQFLAQQGHYTDLEGTYHDLSVIGNHATPTDSEWDFVTTMLREICDRVHSTPAGINTSASMYFIKPLLLTQGVTTYYVEDTPIDNERLLRELNAGYPHIMRGSDNEQNDGGHAWIVDGYYSTSTTNYYHCNWGWAGSSDGWTAEEYYNPISEDVSYCYFFYHLYCVR